MPGYFAAIMDRARLAADLAGGYREVYWKLAALAIVGAVVTAGLRPPGTGAGQDRPVIR